MKITYYQNAESLWNDTTGFDVDASNAKYRELLEDAITKAYPDADVCVEVGHDRMTQCTVETDDAQTETEIIREVEHMSSKIFESDNWYVELTFWRKDNQLHVQSGFRWGNDITLTEDAEWGTYNPLSDEEHKQRGYEQITKAEAEELLDKIGVELQ